MALSPSQGSIDTKWLSSKAKQVVRAKKATETSVYQGLQCDIPIPVTELSRFLLEPKPFPTIWFIWCGSRLKQLLGRLTQYAFAGGYELALGCCCAVLELPHMIRQCAQKLKSTFYLRILSSYAEVSNLWLSYSHPSSIFLLEIFLSCFLSKLFNPDPLLGCRSMHVQLTTGHLAEGINVVLSCAFAHPYSRGALWERFVHVFACMRLSAVSVRLSSIFSSLICGIRIAIFSRFFFSGMQPKSNILQRFDR